MTLLTKVMNSELNKRMSFRVGIFGFMNGRIETGFLNSSINQFPKPGNVELNFLFC